MRNRFETPRDAMLIYAALSRNRAGSIYSALPARNEERKGFLVTVQISLLKVLGCVALVAGIFAPLYADSTTTFIGLHVNVFLTAVGSAAGGIGLLIARQNNQTSEDVKAPNALGTGNGNLPPKTGA